MTSYASLVASSAAGFHPVVERAIAASMEALPGRLSVREMAAAAGVSLGSLQRAFDKLNTTPVAHVQQLCLVAARKELERATGETIFAIARRWGFTSPDGAFRDNYWIRYEERPSDTVKRARLARLADPPPSPDDHVTCLECGRQLRRLRFHLGAVHTLTPEAYRDRWGLPASYPLVCAILSRTLAERARRIGLAREGARFRLWLQQRGPKSAPSQIEGHALHPSQLVVKAEAITEAAVPRRLDEQALATALGVGVRALRRAFLDTRGMTPFMALRDLRLKMAMQMLEDNPALLPPETASRCGFGHYARFRRDFIARFGVEPDRIAQRRAAATGLTDDNKKERASKRGREAAIAQVGHLQRRLS